MSRKQKQIVKSIILVFIFAFAVAMTTAVYGDTASKNDTYESLKLFSDVLEEIQRNYVEPVNTKDLIDKAIQGMVLGLDPHSAFLPPAAYKDLQDDTKGEFGGIGIVITKKDHLLTVISPIEGTPAYKAGIQANDVIIKVDGKSTKDMMLWEAVKLMRGKAGTAVKITVAREGETKPLEFSLVRAIIPLDSVRYVTIKPGYGYLWITNFRENTTEEVEKALASLSQQKVPLKGLILDMRDNPGGLLNQAVDVSDIFLNKGTIVSIKGRNPKDEQVFSAHANTVKQDYPIVLLINGGTASAAEIVTGALQDNHRALVLGTRSFGKGSVQTVKPLRDGYALKYTVALYYTPSGKSIQAEGIQPDLVVKRRLLDESATDGVESRMLKEADLKNHLPGDAAEPPKKSDLGKAEKQLDNETKGETDTERLLRLREAVYKHSGMNPDALLLDSQVNRAYEILKGYNIFSREQK